MVSRQWGRNKLKAFGSMPPPQLTAEQWQMPVMERIAVWHKKLCNEDNDGEYPYYLPAHVGGYGQVFNTAPVLQFVAVEAGDTQIGAVPLWTISMIIAPLMGVELDPERFARDAQTELPPRGQPIPSRPN